MLPSSTTADRSADPQDRPALAPSTWLVGQLVESALADPPWAVEQAKRGYVEMSELAYRVAEQATGEQTVDEIATAVSTVLRRPVSAMDVEALITAVLIPRGVVSGGGGYLDVDDLDGADDGTDGPAWHARHGRPVRRPRVRPARREIVVGPRRLEVLAAVLMWLFWPPVMLVVLGVSLAALAWLYLLHGLAPSIVQVLTRPLLLPVALVLAVLAGMVQGIGRMVALYGAGGAIERMRVRLTLPLPTLDVDLDNDYGLSRWARLMVNVSGVYLQLVLTTVLCTLGMASGAEFLFLTAALLTLNVLRLLLPFGRPGADRLLADLLMVPAPLRYAEQAVERYVPGFAESPQSYPSLKRWGWTVIWVYLGTAALVCLFVGLALLWVTPTVVATTLAALFAYLTAMSQAIGDRDVLGFLGALFKTAVLGLTTFAVVVLLVVAARQVAANAWAWSTRTPRRRLAGGVGAAVAILLLLLFWAPVWGPGGDGPVRSLAGVPFRPLSSLSRGTLLDLF